MSRTSATQKLIYRRLLQPYWRMQRSLTMGAQGVVIRDDGAILMVKHTYKPGWCFPGGGVEKGETVQTALIRELVEECGVAIAGPPELYAIYSNGTNFPNDHVVLFLVRHWSRTQVPAPNSEISAQDFFPHASPPADCAPSTLRRLAEIFAAAPRNELW